MRFILSFFILSVLAAPVVALASQTNGTVDSTNKYAWSNQAGWVNFSATNGNIQISDTGITGHAWNNNYGWINMKPSNGGVVVAANGALSGYAWGANLGWINFSGVSINSSGKFVGQATGSIIGTLTFDCANCDVTTDYRPINFRTTTTASPSNGSNSGGGWGNTSGLSGTTDNPSSLEAPALNPSASNTDSITQTPSGMTENLLPAQLFDIRLLIDSSSALRSEDIVSRVTFESFGRIPTPVEMTFTVFDSKGNEIWKIVDSTTVQTSAVYTKRLPVLNLATGDYVLKLHTRYNTSVEDNFQTPFKIVSEKDFFNWLPWFIGILASLIILLLIIKLIRDKIKRDEEKRGLQTPW